MSVNVKSFTLPASAGWNGRVTWRDTTSTSGKAYYYQVQSFKPDADYWTPIIGPLSGPGQGTPTGLPNLVSPWTGVANLTQAPVFFVNPTSLTFGPQAYQTQSAVQTFTVANHGVVNLLLSAPTVSGGNAADFVITATTCPVTPTPLASAATCTISVAFKPTYPGTRSSWILIPSNDPGNPTPRMTITGTGNTIPLTITASSPTVTWAPTGLPAITAIAQYHASGSGGELRYHLFVYLHGRRAGRNLHNQLFGCHQPEQRIRVYVRDRQAYC